MTSAYVVGAMLGAANWLLAIHRQRRDWWFAWNPWRAGVVVCLSLALAAATGALAVAGGETTGFAPTGDPALDGAAASALALAVLRADVRQPQDDRRDSLLTAATHALEDALDAVTVRNIRRWSRSLRGDLLIQECYNALQLVPGRVLEGPELARAQMLDATCDKYQHARTSNDRTEAMKLRAALASMLADHFEAHRTRDEGRPHSRRPKRSDL